MTASFDTFTADGRVVITFPEDSVPVADREDFIASLKAEWTARQSRLTTEQAAQLADEVDHSWWARNRERILHRIEGA